MSLYVICWSSCVSIKNSEFSESLANTQGIADLAIIVFPGLLENVGVLWPNGRVAFVIRIF